MAKRKLEDFLSYDDDVITESTNILLAAKQALLDGNMSSSEFEEIVNDVTEIADIDDMAITLERKIMIREAYLLIRSLLSAIQ